MDHGPERQAARTEQTPMVSLAASPGLSLSSGLHPEEDRRQQNIWICPKDVFIWSGAKLPDFAFSLYSAINDTEYPPFVSSI